MSQKGQMKKILSFLGCAKIECFPSWHGSGVSGSVCLSLLVSVYAWCSLYDMRGYLGISGIVFWDISISFGDQMCSGIYLRPCPCCIGSGWKTHHFGTTLEGGSIFHLDLMGHQNIKTSLIFLEKNHWGRPFFALFSSVRAKLQLTVSLNHPVLGLGVGLDHIRGLMKKSL